MELPNVYVESKMCIIASQIHFARILLPIVAIAHSNVKKMDKMIALVGKIKCIVQLQKNAQKIQNQMEFAFPVGSISVMPMKIIAIVVKIMPGVLNSTIVNPQQQI